MSKKLTYKTKAEQRHLDRVVALGCIVCRNEGLGESPAVIHDDDVDFVEQCVLQAFDVNDPVYIIGVSYYTTRKKISDLTRDLQEIAPWLTSHEARERVKWCLQIFKAKVFLVAKNQDK
ncbi:hypothetical protein FDX01_06260 [Citrobacter sp. wls613]|nr:hypothetical protein FDX01_06260 [Citrobacter sp. wls613]